MCCCTAVLKDKLSPSALKEAMSLLSCTSQTTGKSWAVATNEAVYGVIGSGSIAGGRVLNIFHGLLKNCRCVHRRQFWLRRELILDCAQKDVWSYRFGGRLPYIPRECREEISQESPRFLLCTARLVRTKSISSAWMLSERDN